MSARILQCTAADYHLDPSETPSLSSSIAHTLVSKSPRHAHLEHPRLGARRRPPTKETDAGSLIHELILGCGGGFDVVDAEDWRTKDAKEARDASRAMGRVPVLRGDMDDAITVVSELKHEFDQLGIALSGASEVTVLWEETAGRRQVSCRCRMDHLILSDGVIYDVKTIRSAHPRICEKHMVEYGYDIQWAAYSSALAALRPNLAGHVDFAFLFCEIEPPYCVTPARPDGSMRQLGAARWGRAVETWEECLRTNTWPGYANGFIALAAPPWAISQEFGDLI